MIREQRDGALELHRIGVVQGMLHAGNEGLLEPAQHGIAWTGRGIELHRAGRARGQLGAQALLQLARTRFSPSLATRRTTVGVDTPATSASRAADCKPADG